MVAGLSLAFQRSSTVGAALREPPRRILTCLRLRSLLVRCGMYVTCLGCSASAGNGLTECYQYDKDPQLVRAAVVVRSMSLASPTWLLQSDKGVIASGGSFRLATRAS